MMTYDLIQSRLKQARESLDGAKALLTENMDLKFAANGVNYGMRYAVCALL